jgi:3-hydroxyacyl-[acyl-carrier-protein] dehydratase
MNSQDIISLLPYQKPFLFVDELVQITENGVEGNYTYNRDEFYYKGHFKNNPVTPGVILTETMAQIGLVCLGIYLLKNDNESFNDRAQVALTAHQVDFFKPVFPGDKVTVKSEKIYFRFSKLKCKVKLTNASNDLVAKGVIAGMFKNGKDE